MSEYTKTYLDSYFERSKDLECICRFNCNLCRSSDKFHVCTCISNIHPCFTYDIPYDTNCNCGRCSPCKADSHDCKCGFIGLNVCSADSHRICLCKTHPSKCTVEVHECICSESPSKCRVEVHDCICSYFLWSRTHNTKCLFHKTS